MTILTRTNAYGQRAWRKARLTHLAHSPQCTDCGAPATEVDHDPPHDGTRATFWNTDTWFSRCKSCHSKQTTTRDGFGFRRGNKAQTRVAVVRVASTRVGAW